MHPTRPRNHQSLHLTTVKEDEGRTSRSPIGQIRRNDLNEICHERRVLEEPTPVSLSPLQFNTEDVFASDPILKGNRVHAYVSAIGRFDVVMYIDE